MTPMPKQSVLISIMFPVWDKKVEIVYMIAKPWEEEAKKDLNEV